MPATILVVDDQPKIVEVVRRYLERDGHAVLTAADGEEALQIFRDHQPDLIVLDLMLPKVDGWTVCKRVRAESATPIVMLTARAEETDTLVGLDLGADDYVTKPFSPRELVARVRAVLRRATPEDRLARDRLAVGPWTLDAARLQARWNGEALALSPTEFRLFWALAGQPGRSFTRAQLLDTAYAPAQDPYERTIDVHVKNLRRKMRALTATPWIETVQGVGYRFAEPSRA